MRYLESIFFFDLLELEHGEIFYQSTNTQDTGYKKKLIFNIYELELLRLMPNSKQDSPSIQIDSLLLESFDEAIINDSLKKRGFNFDMEIIYSGHIPKNSTKLKLNNPLEDKHFWQNEFIKTYGINIANFLKAKIAFTQ